MRVIAVRALKGSLEEAPREVANGQRVRVSRCASPAGGDRSQTSLRRPPRPGADRVRELVAMLPDSLG